MYNNNKRIVRAREEIVCDVSTPANSMRTNALHTHIALKTTKTCAGCALTVQLIIGTW